MTKSDCERTEEEIDKLLNDPETPMHPDRIWALAEALAQGNCEGADQLT
jgi:predicted ATPase